MPDAMPRTDEPSTDPATTAAEGPARRGGAHVAPPPRPRTRARRGEGDRLRNEILHAAEALLVEHSDPEAVSIRAITDRVGCTAPSVYRHFADKDALLVEVCRGAFAHFDEYIQSRMPANATPLDALAACARAYVDFAMDHPGAYRVLFISPTIDDFPLRPDGTSTWSRKAASRSCGSSSRSRRPSTRASCGRPPRSTWRASCGP